MFGGRYYGPSYYGPRYWGTAESTSPPLFSGPIPGLRERENSGTHQLDTSLYFSGADTYAIAQSIEAGWSFDTNTGVLSIDTDAVGTFGPYVVTATNVNGDTDSNAFSVTVAEAEATSSGGGWLFLNHYESELQRRKARERRRRELEEETERIEAQLDRQIAQELRKQEALDDKRENLSRLAEIAKQSADIEAARQYSERVAVAYARALTKGNFSALEALDRELQRAREEEDFLIMSVLMTYD